MTKLVKKNFVVIFHFPNNHLLMHFLHSELPRWHRWWRTCLLVLQETQEMRVLSQGQKDPLEEENGNPLQCSCLGNSMNRGAWWATVHGVVTSQTWLSTQHIAIFYILGINTKPRILFMSLQKYFSNIAWLNDILKAHWSRPRYGGQKERPAQRLSLRKWGIWLNQWHKERRRGKHYGKQ